MTDRSEEARHRPGLLHSGTRQFSLNVAALGRELGVALHCAAADAPLDVAQLTAGERQRWETFGSERRRADWLTGRRALKTVLIRLGMSSDTSALSFPHASVSLSHAGGVAVAVGSNVTAGIGVDFEPRRELRPGIARRFLDDGEAAAAPDARTNHGLLRLWTVKEALYKACPGNAALALRDIRLLDASRLAGRARVGHGFHLRYVSASALGGWLSVALLEDRGRHGDASPGR